VRRDDLDVLNRSASVAAVVLDTGVGELNVSILVRQLVLMRPTGDGLGPLFGRLSPFSARSVFCREEPLILALQFLFENHTADGFAPFDQALSGLRVRAIDSGIVGQLTGFCDPDVERLLTAVAAGPSPSFENFSPTASERHERRTRASDDVRHGLHQAEVAKALQVASRARRCPRIRFSQVACGHDAERSDCRKYAHVVTRQSILPVVHTDALS
jgi:hypothetical protein